VPSAVKVDQALIQASDLSGWLHQQLWEYRVPASPRTRLAGACFAAVQEHHDAIATLIERKIYGSAFALVRVLFEAYVRGIWLANCATEREIVSFQKDIDPPGIGQQLLALEKAGFGDSQLSGIKKRSWKAMNSYTHTGMMQVWRWNSPDGIEPNFLEDEVVEALQFAGTVMLLSGLGMAAFNEDLSLSERILGKCTEWVESNGSRGS
jgi:hypothetical protein